MPSVHAILQSGNLYMFTLHNPVRWIDPSGLYLKCPVKLWEMVKAGHKYADQALKWFINENIKFARWAGGHIQRGWNAISNWFSSSAMALSSVPGTFTLNKGAVQHISKHIVELFVKQVPHIKPGRLATKLESLSFFNPSWTQQQVNFFVEQSVNFLHSQGITTGKHVVKWGDELITIAFNPDGVFKTAWGMHKLTIDFFLR